MNWIKTWVSRLLVGAAIVLLGLVLVRATFLFLKLDWNVVKFPYPVDYGEGPVLDQVIHLAKFENIYRPNPTEPPFTISNYPPLFHLVQLPFVWIFGAAYWYGRAISVLSIIATAIFIMLIIQTLTGNWIAGAAGGLTLFTFPYILQWSSFDRVDSLALALSMAGLYVIARWPHTRGGLVITGCLLTAAIFTKQSFALTAPFAAFIWLISQKPPFQAFKLAILVIGLSLVLFLLLMVLSRGAFYFNIITSNVNKFYWNTVRDYANGIWDHLPYFIISSGLFLLVCGWFKVRSWWLLAPYLLAATASAITVGKDGSSVNYIYELSAAFSLVAGTLLALPGKRWWAQIPLILLLAAQINSVYDWDKNDYFQWIYNRVINDRSEITQLQEIVRDSKDPVLADEFMGLIPLAGKELQYQPFEFKQLVIAKVWDETSFLESIQQKKYGVILLYDPPTWDSQHARWTQDQLDAIYSYYDIAGRYANTNVYLPKR